MRAVRVDEFGGPEVLVARELPDPEPGPGEVLLEVTGANVMYLDTLVRSGWATDHFPVAPPYVPGGGVSGRVVGVGPGADPAWMGLEVVGETGRPEGGDGKGNLPVDGYAERAVVHEDSLLRVPEGVDAHEALALMTDGSTALMLERAARFTPDSWVLVLAATGGAGSLVVQLARLAGARVIGAARGPEKLALARKLGAEETVDYSEPGWVERVVGITGRGADVVIDGAGGALGTAAFAATADGGRFISYGTSSGEFAEADEAEAERRGITSLGLFDLEGADGTSRWDLARLAMEEGRAGRVRPHVGLTLPLERAAEAHAALEGRRVLGKVLLVP
ncbi:zinc-binding dehydrogenase [Nocardiopsis ganjiahuensis]|uniref:zinc-binding dehydrogenase n=1 Tax=Nocardiopsis ganjiahuensis TaxID=239984 RepID=UPI000476EEB3|nr:zinc-binding dehydrogenase [Nocardiopsis ganjiahuensis]